MREKIKVYIIESIINNELDISYEDDLLNSGLIDSIGVIKLINYLEEEFSIQVPPEEMLIENFVSVEAISSYISKIKQ